MPRIRTIKPEWIEDERFNACSDAAIRLAKVLYALVDDDGRCKKSVRALGLDGWKYCDAVADKTAHAQAAVNELVACRWLVGYVVSGEQYWSIRNFAVHQKINHYVASRLPAPPDDSCTSPENSGDLQRGQEDSLLIGSGMEWNGTDTDPRARVPDPVVPKHIRRFEDSFRPRPTAGANEVSMADVESAFHAQRKAAGGGAYKNPRHRDDEHLEPIAESVNAAGETLEQRKLALRDTIAGFLADQGAKGAGWPIAWLARDPGRYLAAFRETKSAPTTKHGANPKLAAAQAARDAAEKACADARRRRDSLAGQDGHEEASRDFLRKQRILGDADDALEAAKREVAA